MTPEFIYLHGFASSPESSKALFLKTHLARWGISLRIPDLNTPNFPSLTLTSMIERLAQEVQECSPAPVYIIGSSLGALVALHFIDRFKQGKASRVERLMFLAPSLDFVQNRLQKMGSDALAKWKEIGWFKFHHHSYSKDYKVSYKLIDDIKQYDSYRTKVNIPILIFHGLQDENVNYEQSVKFVKKSNNVALRLVDSDHRLLDQLDYIWSSASQFFDLCTIYPAKSQITIRVYDLGSANHVHQFNSYEGKFLDVLEAAYGSKFYGRELQLNRIYGKGHSFGAHHVFLAFSKSVRKNNLVGCSYIRPDGKRGATSVLPEYQGQGIGRQLICASTKLFDKQFTEISPSDLRMRHLLMSLGFRAVLSETDLEYNLGEGISLLHSIRYDGDSMIYTRSIAACQGIKREFIMFKYQREFQ